MMDKISEVLSYARVAQLPYLVRRAMRLPASEPSHFVEPIDAATSARLQAIAEAVRGPDARPVVFVHGVLPRSGTNYLADILALHPDVMAHPGRLWEFPLLYVAPGAKALQREFVTMFKPNGEVTSPYDFLALTASAWMAMLQRETPDKTLVLKTPHVQNIGLFRHIFPKDKLVLCLRDGRDVVQSSLDTFKDGGITQKSIAELCREWAYGTDAILDHRPGGPLASPDAHVAYYEAIAANDRGKVEEILRAVGLDPAVFPFDRYEALPVRGSSRSSRQGNDRWSTPESRSADFKSVGRWADWPESRKRVFKKIAGPALIRAGYAPSDAW